MAASSNESFGLKIATAFSIALTVVLLVLVYFLNSNYNLATEQNAAAQRKIADLNKVQGDLTSQYNELRNTLGYQGLDDIEAIKGQVKKDQDQLKADIKTIEGEINAVVSDYQKRLEAKGIDASQFEALKARAREVVDAFMNNSDQSYKAGLFRLKDLTINQAKLTTILALNYIDVRRDLEQANQLNSKAKQLVQDALDSAKAELDATIKKDEERRAELVRSNQEKADQLQALDTKLTNITNDMTSKAEKRETVIKQLGFVIRDMSDRQSRKEDVMTKPGGRVTFVDYETKTIRVSVSRAQGVRPQMRFTIFDKNSIGVTGERPKALVELTKVGDPQRGEYDSEARIVRTENPTEPIRYNDFIYSVGWSYDHPQRFALVGKLDVNRDGRDDRADLIRMIEAAGGIVEFDLPPPNVDRTAGQAAVARGFARLGEPVPSSVGRASGKISGLAYAYVTDDRPTLILNQKKGPDATKEDTAFLAEASEATREAREAHVRPLPLEKLLNMLGYDFSAPIEGRREAFDRPGVKGLLKPKGGVAPPATPPTSPDTPKDDSGAMPETPK